MGTQQGDGRGGGVEGSTATPYTPPMRERRLLVEIAGTVAVTALAFYLIQGFVAQPFKVEQTSMEQTFEPGQYVMVDKLTPRFTGFHRGDVVVFLPPSGWPQGKKESPTPYIKRVIGLPGETITLVNGVVSVNGGPLSEPYIYRDDDGASLEGENGSWTLGPDELLVMGDHRSNSSDSRNYGPVPTSAVIGRAMLRYYPIDRIGIVAAPDYVAPSP